jgi:hypothetical protein
MFRHPFGPLRLKDQPVVRVGPHKKNQQKPWVVVVSVDRKPHFITNNGPGLIQTRKYR